MPKLSISKFQRRFLIVWLLFHSFALFVNVAKIRGKLVDKRIVHEASMDFQSRDIETNTYVYAFSSDVESRDFWPFSHFYENRVPDGYAKYSNVRIHRFNGIFFGYGWDEFAFYVAIGFVFIFIRKLW